MSKLEELRKQEAELEQERMNYLEADDNKGAKRIEKKLYRVRDLIEVEHENGCIGLKKQLDIHRKYIQKMGLDKNFNDFYKKEIESEDKQ